MQIRLASIFFFFILLFLSFSFSYLNENCFDTNLFTSPGCLVKQPTNCSRLSRKRRRRRGPVPLSLAALLLCVVVWLFCSGGMWTIAHPSSAGPSWRPSIKDEETTRTSKSPIHFCLCRDIYHGDVIEISIHPVCVPCPPHRLCVFHFLPEKWPHRSRIGTWKWEKRRRLFGGNRKKKYIFLAKEIADKTWNNSGFSPFYPTIPPSASYFCFMDLAVIVGLHTKVWFISIRLSLLF